MSSRQTQFRWMYRIGFAPWDGHRLAKSLRDLVGDSAIPAGKALDLGCGTGDNAIYLATHGWQVTGVDFVAKAVEKARAKAAAKNVDVTFAQANVTRLSAEGIRSGFDLIIDSGCLHGMSSADRDAYVREVTAVAAPRARLLLNEFIPGGSFAVPGIEPAEVERRFASGWTMLASGSEPEMDRNGKDPARYYLYQRGS
jgi:2-polyprenyl-3-methyl-5-hydroxy-6-metoxy-1,4-benzoquinol methylase